jgi:type II secretory pathway component PulF
VRASPREFAEFNGLLATVVDRRLPLAPAFGLLAGVVRTAGLRDALRGVGRGLDEGMALPDALGRYPEVFPADYCGLVRASSDSDRLADVLRTIQTHHLLRARIQAKFFRLFLYVVSGVILGELALGSALMMNGYIGGMYAEVTAQLGIVDAPELNPATFRQFTTALMIALPVGFLVLGLLYKLLQRWTGAGWIGYALPVWGSIQKSRDLARFCCAVGLRLRSGAPMVEALHGGCDAVANRRFRQLVDGLVRRVSEGESLSTALYYDRFFPKTLSWGISLAEENGELPRALDTFAGLYNQQMERGFELLHELLTPLGILTIGNVVLLAALMVLSPLFVMIKISETLSNK